MSLFDYDYDDLAQQLAGGLDRLAINFLRSHGARFRRDLVDFHGNEQVDLELTHAGHTLKVHQVGPPRGFGQEQPPALGGVEPEFESTFDGWPTEDIPLDQLISWLRGLPVGEAPPERQASPDFPANPFAAERKPTPRLDAEPGPNPFLGERRDRGGPNPFADAERDRRRNEALRRLKGED